MANRITASVKMRVVVEVTPPDTWGDDCGIEQIEKQGRESALNTLQGIFALAGQSGLGNRVRIVEMPDRIQVVLNVEKR